MRIIKKVQLAGIGECLVTSAGEVIPPAMGETGPFPDPDAWAKLEVLIAAAPRIAGEMAALTQLPAQKTPPPAPAPITRRLVRI